MHITPYLNFPGTCEEAMNFYAKVLNGKIGAMMRFEGTPMAQHMPAERHQKIIHARLDFDGQMLMASDAGPDHFKPMQGMTVAINLADNTEAERIFAELSKDAKSVDMPLQETFWAERFAMFVDRFGTAWLINSGPKTK